MSKIEAIIFDAGGVDESNSAVTDDLAKELELEQTALEAIWRDKCHSLAQAKLMKPSFGSRFTINTV